MKFGDLFIDGATTDGKPLICMHLGEIAPLLPSAMKGVREDGDDWFIMLNGSPFSDDNRVYRSPSEVKPLDISLVTLCKLIEKEIEHDT